MKTLINSVNLVVTLMLAGAAVWLILIALPIFGNRALIVRSASMDPTFPVGSLIVAKEQEKLLVPQPALATPLYQVGDVISFRGKTNPQLITTHRVSSVEIERNKVFYQTKGDANKNVDDGLVSEENVVGKVALSLPYLGKFFAFTKSNVGFPLLVIFPALLVIIFESFNLYKEVKKQKVFSENPLPSNLSFSGLKILMPVFVSVLVFQNSWAFFSDAAQSLNNVFSASATFPTPTPSPTPTPPPIAQVLVINEVLPDTSCSVGQTEAQWLEVYNGFAVTVNLKNFKITDGTNVIDLVSANSVNIPAGGFALLSHNSAIWNSCYSDNGAITANLGGQLNIDTEFLQLLDAGNNVIDTVQWGGTTGLNPTQNQSIERNPDGLDSATGTNFNASDFVVRTTPQPGL